MGMRPAFIALDIRAADLGSWRMNLAIECCILSKLSITPLDNLIASAPYRIAGIANLFL